MSVEAIDEIPAEKYQTLGLTREDFLWLLRKMCEMRKFEERVERLFFEGQLIGPCHLYLGQEAVAAGVIKALDDEDFIISTYRGHGHAIARAVPFEALMAELFGRKTGTCKGLGGSMHSAMSLEHNILLASAIVGGGIPIAVGVGLALQYRKSSRIVAVFFGDGAVNTGAFHEALNLAAVWKLPVLFVCENNFYAFSVPHKKSFAGESIAARASSYGIKAYLVDGNDVIAVYTSGKDAVAHIRSGCGPAFIECRTYRKKGHGVYDKAEYRPQNEVQEWMKKDPIERFANNLMQLGIITKEEFEALNMEIEKVLDVCVEKAKAAPCLDFSELWKLVYAEEEAHYG
ncbi:MAG: thiamine pyrophosphate-dependent dehydrogenase E1 component subunit alpha [Candidatus Bathyarchaeia archaeon]